MDGGLIELLSFNEGEYGIASPDEPAVCRTT